MFGSVLFSRADQKLARGLCKSFFSVIWVVFQDGGGNHPRVQDDHTIIGAVLDRNGLRPSRDTVTEEDMVIMASETGVLEVPPQDRRCKGRLQPGRMFLIDIEKGRIVEDEEIEAEIAARCMDCGVPTESAGRSDTASRILNWKNGCWTAA